MLLVPSSRRNNINRTTINILSRPLDREPEETL